ncbi:MULTISPECIES: RIP metalloprotease RseP [Sphaerospermopsis]|jgi:membrane-associated protease RseP (regulator of RpoE activity)|uniref:Zinc metalloprotease n=1 Tax=Sphaerospermopsis aphanizomenoides LEGE 00250 TaxID=2777972 RepID=A0ABR9VGC9_9CYAN|nr:MULTISPECIES: RIP metalloprotease RseP [Sphaerospermopsis]MBD2133940.1 RIP metalloprotease RseP [Sphaerospermopsis sp. FACHB-1094]MBD2146999.1 RIP metalloprotease RseP [Sphaerospermopsis sp. FACHB-1194]MBE9236445.1 RIP metalloprotease RseP [Sphaerospermopsis aphanizomenoides LEGE 00250]
MSVLAAIAVLAILILVHELGHFIAARSQGIYANRFSLGFGPTLLKYQGSQTEYTIRAFPLGGFVGFPDDDPDSAIPPNDPNLLRNRPILDRAIVISAGVIANLIFAYFVLALQIGIVGIPQEFQYQPGVLVKPVNEQSIAYQAGIRAGDIVISVNGQELAASKDSTLLLTKEIQTHPNQQLNLKIQRQNQEIALKLTPTESADGKGLVGIELGPNGEAVYRRPQNPIEIFSVAADRFQQLFIGTIKGFGQLITNFQQTASQVSGPVNIVKIGAKLAADNSANLLSFAAIISINLAIINILPLPALDGGQLAFLLIEGLLGKPLPAKIQEGVMQTGLVLLLGLGIFLIFKETLQLEFVQQIFQKL